MYNRELLTEPDIHFWHQLIFMEIMCFVALLWELICLWHVLLVSGVLGHHWMLIISNHFYSTHYEKNARALQLSTVKADVKPKLRTNGNLKMWNMKQNDD